MFGSKEYGCPSKVDNGVVVRRGSTLSPLYLTWEGGCDTFNYRSHVIKSQSGVISDWSRQYV